MVQVQEISNAVVFKCNNSSCNYVWLASAVFPCPNCDCTDISPLNRSETLRVIEEV